MKYLFSRKETDIFYARKQENKYSKTKNTEMTHIKKPLPRMKGSKRTTFRGAERRCKSV